MRSKTVRSTTAGRRILLAVTGAVLLGAVPLLAAAQARNGRPADRRKPPSVSFLPNGNLEQFVIAQFDVRTINSSVNVGRETYQARLLELGYRPLPRNRANDPVVLDSPTGTITLTLFERGDHNNDGIEDVLICLNDRSKDGGFNATQPLILQKYSEATPLVALAVGVDDPRCPRQS